MQLPEWKPGDEILASDLNALADAASRAGDIRVDPGSGIEAVRLPDGGIVLRDKRPLAIWVKITGGGAGGVYAGTQQLEQSGGTWANGPRTFTTGGGTLIEANLNASVPTSGNTIVRAFRDRKFWRFSFGAC